MEKKPLHLGLYSGRPLSSATDEEVRAQWNRGPKVSGKSLATGLVRQGKATPPEKKSEGSRND